MKLQDWLKSDKNKEYSTRRPMCIYDQISLIYDQISFIYDQISLISS
jgi:hypothetical protein